MGHTVDDRLRATNNAGRGVSQPRAKFKSASEKELDYALDLVRDAVVVLDPHGRITYLNHAAEALHGLTSSQLIGKSARTTLYSGCQTIFDAAWSDILSSGTWSGNIAQETKRGVECLMESRWTAVWDQHASQITSVVIVSTEILSARLTTASLAHEIKNPLASIKGVADALLRRQTLTRQEREWMKAVRREVVKIDSRLRELLDVSHSRALNTRSCALSELISRAIMLATHQLHSIKKRRVSVEFIDDTLEPVVLPLDPSRIEDAILNLVLNAIESIEANGRVTVCLRRRSAANGASEAVIEVADTGCGIPLEIRRRIFEPLFTTKREGTGLGLAAVRRTAAAYHGRITFKTRIDRGSTFVLTLPIRSQPVLTENREATPF